MLLESVVHAKIGDKESNANRAVGLPCRRISLAMHSPDQFYLHYSAGRRLQPGGIFVERFELPNHFALHFLVKGILEGGISCTYKMDGLAKSFGEFIRARWVEVPTKFLERGTI